MPEGGIHFDDNNVANDGLHLHGAKYDPGFKQKVCLDEVHLEGPPYRDTESRKEHV